MESLGKFAKNARNLPKHPGEGKKKVLKKATLQDRSDMEKLIELNVTS